MTTKSTKTRLNAAMRNAILQDLLDPPLVKGVSNLMTQMHTLARDVYDAVYSPADLELMTKIPIGWLQSRNDIYVQMGGHQGSLNLSFSGDFLSYRVESICGFFLSQHVTGADVILATPAWNNADSIPEGLKQRCHAFIDARSVFLSEVQVQVRDITTNLKSYTTVEDLCTGWPEIAAVVRKHVTAKEIIHLPTVPVASINAFLGVPRETALLAA